MTINERAEKLFEEKRSWGIEEWTIEDCRKYAEIESKVVEVEIIATGKIFYHVLSVIKSCSNRKFNPETKKWSVQFDSPIGYKQTVMTGRAKIA